MFLELVRHDGPKLARKGVQFIEFIKSIIVADCAIVRQIRKA